jgi:hypothetical protein
MQQLDRRIRQWLEQHPIQAGIVFGTLWALAFAVPQRHSGTALILVAVAAGFFVGALVVFLFRRSNRR